MLKEQTKMAKRSKTEQIKRFMWEFPERTPEDYTATSRLLERLKPPQEFRNGHNNAPRVSAGGSDSAPGIRNVPDRPASGPIDTTQPDAHAETDGHN